MTAILVFIIGKNLLAHGLVDVIPLQAQPISRRTGPLRSLVLVLATPMIRVNVKAPKHVYGQCAMFTNGGLAEMDLCTVHSKKLTAILDKAKQ